MYIKRFPAELGGTAVNIESAVTKPSESTDTTLTLTKPSSTVKTMGQIPIQ